MSNHNCAITDSNSRNQTAKNVGGGESKSFVYKILSIYTPVATNFCFQHIQYTTVAETFALTIDTRTRKRFQLPALRAYKELGLCGLHLLLLMYFLCLSVCISLVSSSCVKTHVDTEHISSETPGINIMQLEFFNFLFSTTSPYQ
jgi:hypothetical protein